jgi:isopentenyldiphosphate isomerase
MEPNMNEVSDAKYVSKDELEAMFAESSKLPYPRCA